MSSQCTRPRTMNGAGNGVRFAPRESAVHGTDCPRAMQKRQNSLEASFGEVYASLQHRVEQRRSLMAAFEAMLKNPAPPRTGASHVTTSIGVGVCKGVSPSCKHSPQLPELVPPIDPTIESAVSLSSGIRTNIPVRSNRVARRRPPPLSQHVGAEQPLSKAYQADGAADFGTYIEQSVIDSAKRRQRGGYHVRDDEEDNEKLWMDVETTLIYMEKACSQSTGGELRHDIDSQCYVEQQPSPVRHPLERSSTLSECVMDGPALFRGHNSVADLSPTLYVTLDDLPPRIRELLRQAADMSPPPLSRNNTRGSQCSRTLHDDVSRVYQAFREGEGSDYFDYTIRRFPSDSLPCSP
ncbi:hypothetical protein BV22DRAFT_1043642 [Leucogyrophana mollusca]|uniref:Uncharacterized protein n=1 Tax=Leucogyrophana mollusca TaxID=85980 RepID=A0ACB8BYH4_9AGAM|nr:hypothetical protein BV22DRAFT_1043642 [Leucogyrophana mollusca]